MIRRHFNSVSISTNKKKERKAYPNIIPETISFLSFICCYFPYSARYLSAASARIASGTLTAILLLFLIAFNKMFSDPEC
jgi:hypothetical protein